LLIQFTEIQTVETNSEEIKIKKKLKNTLVFNNEKSKIHSSLENIKKSKESKTKIEETPKRFDRYLDPKLKKIDEKDIESLQNFLKNELKWSNEESKIIFHPIGRELARLNIKITKKKDKIKSAKLIRDANRNFLNFESFLFSKLKNVFSLDWLENLKLDLPSSPQIKNEIKVAVINSGDKINPHEMFTNPSDPSFENFLKAMDLDVNDKNANRNKMWNHVNFTFFVATQLNKDEHRRDVGNAPSFIFYKNSEGPFNASEIDTIGMVPQIFIVVQPYKDDLYRIGCFNSGNMRSYDPPIPENYIFPKFELKHFILTKIHNGNVNFYYSSPMNRMFVQKKSRCDWCNSWKSKKRKIILMILSILNIT